MMNGHGHGQRESASGPSRRKDKHVSRACNSCRRKKSKCDGVQPVCSTCAGTQVECTWTTEEDGRRPATKAQVDAMSMEIRTLKTDKERQAAEIERLRAEVARLSTASPNPSPSPAPQTEHTRHSSLSISIPSPRRPAQHAHTFSEGATTPFLGLPPGSPAAHSPGSVTSSLPSPMPPSSSQFLMVPTHGHGLFRGASPDSAYSTSTGTDDDEPPRSALSDSDRDDAASGILPSFTSTEKKLAISDDQDGLFAIGGASPLALTCSPPHTPARSRASSFRGSFSSSQRPELSLSSFRFPPGPTNPHAAPTPHNSLSSPTAAELELEHGDACPCDWARFLPAAVRASGLTQAEHDALLDAYFTFGAGWGLRVVRHKFLRDMRAALSLPSTNPSQSNPSNSQHPNQQQQQQLPPTAHWSPALHCALLADASSYAPPTSPLSLPSTRTALASAARDFADAELTKESGLIAAVTALAVLSRYHLGTPKGARLAYARFGMAVRVAVAAGLNMDCGEWVRMGRIDEEEKWDRDWCYFALMVQDVDVSLHVGQDLSLPPPPPSLRPPPLSSHAVSQGPMTADGVAHEVFVVTVSLMRLAARMMAVLQGGSADPTSSPHHNANDAGAGAAAGGKPTIDASAVSAVQSALARWHADLPDALQWHRTSSTSAPPNVIVLHMAHWWITIMLHRPFYSGPRALEESVKFIDDAARKILRALSTYERLYTLARVPLSVTQMAFAAGAAALLRADAAQPGAMKRRREALEAVGAAVHALRAMGAAWPCAAGYADALEQRATLVGRPRPFAHSPSPSFSSALGGSGSGGASGSGHGHSHSLSVPAVVVNTDPDDGTGALSAMFNVFGGPAPSPYPPSSPAAPMPMSMDFDSSTGGGGLGLWPGDATVLQPDAMLMQDVYTSPSPHDMYSPSAQSQDSHSQQTAGYFGVSAQGASPTQDGGYVFQSSPTSQQQDAGYTFQSSPTQQQQQEGFAFQSSPTHGGQQQQQFQSSPTQQDGFVFHSHSHSQGGSQDFGSQSQDFLQTHAHAGSQGFNSGWPAGTSPSGWSQ